MADVGEIALMRKDGGPVVSLNSAASENSCVVSTLFASCCSSLFSGGPSMFLVLLLEAWLDLKSPPHCLLLCQRPLVAVAEHMSRSLLRISFFPAS